MIRTVLTLLWLTIASVYDLKTRRVPNWLTFGAMAAAVLLMVLVPVRPSWPAIAVNALTVLIVLWQWARKEFGGADAKATIALALTFYWLPLAALAMLGALALAFTRRRRVTRTRFVPWMALGMAGALGALLILQGTLP